MIEQSRIKKLKCDGLLTIATGRSRKELEWKNKEMSWSQLAEKLSHTTRTHETFEEYKRYSKARRDEIKDVGGFVGGALKGGRRKSGSVSWRQLVTLDADFVKGDLWDSVEAILGCGAIMYSTHSHSPSGQRLRLVIPLKRPVSSDEYAPIARRIAADIGIDFFDDTTYEAHRLMYWPSTSSDGEYVFRFADEPWLDPDEVLERYKDWRDSSYWPESSRAKSDRTRLAERQGDPREKGGIVGAFCRTYSAVDAIDKFLQGVYTSCDDPSRYTYEKGSTSGGLVIYGEGDFAYSHHGSDPISGKLCNAFDLVRLHRFAELDEDAKEGTPVNKLPSYKAMQELSTKDAAVKKQIAGERMAAASEDFGVEADWQEGLEINNNGELKNTLSNMILILRHDSLIASVFYNELREGIDVEGEVPWKRLKRGWNKTDEASLAGYIDSAYGLYSPGKLKEAVIKVSVERSRHPVREYLRGLPEWDKVRRVDELLISYLGAEDNVYTREAMRKTLVAAVARTMNPGIKYDTVLVLNGPQGIGKSTLFSKLGGKFFSDSLSISDMRDKTAAEKLQGYWIVEIGELAGIKKVDEDTLKSFITRQDDKFRASYGYSVEDHPRQSILVGTTNQEAGFLRDLSGGRRFWPVKTPGGTRLKPWNLDDIDQIWAEVMEYYNQGESLILSDEAEKIAGVEQIEALESDDREGIVREYLDKLLPSNWDAMEICERRSFIRGDDFGDAVKGSVRRDKVCAMEIWCELFGKEASAMRKIDSYEINAIMRKIPGWEKYSGNRQSRARVPIYGIQRIFTRKSEQE
ncbi:virulence-associated E family protein [Peptoclostridium acidaminophilum]|nr:virulence-associated E family protein [Peptoclostridium acidaminophilum]